MEDQDLMDKRTYFIADRVMISQIFCLLLTGAFTLFVELLYLTEIFLNLWWLFLILLPIISIIIIAVKKEWLYFDNHWFVTFVFLSIIWLSFTFYLGILVDWFFGARNAFVLSLFMIVMYGAGYLLARMLRMLRNSFSNGVLTGIACGISALIITFSIIFGVLVYDGGMRALGITDPFDLLFNPLLYQSQTLIFGIYIIIIGIGTTISMGLQYYTLYALYDPKGLDVEEDPPNELYLKMMIGSLVITFVAWILLLLLFPPIAGGGGGGSKKRSSSSSSSSKSSSGGRYTRVYHYSRYRTYRYYGIKNPRDVYPPEVVDDEWKEHDLGKN